MHIWLSGYEISNLREMFQAISKTFPDHPLKVFNNGDWFAQVQTKLTQGFILPNNPPNQTAEQLIAQFALRVDSWDEEP